VVGSIVGNRITYHHYMGEFVLGRAFVPIMALALRAIFNFGAVEYIFIGN
jgi:hypothetical protein